jgi:nicotinamide-nucleotide amidase
MDEEVLAQAEALLQSCREAGIKLATAESCTGGLIAAFLTAIAGSSDVVDRGFVTYSNESKTDLVGVDAALIERDGAVSESVARAMAVGALARSQAQLTIAVTGIAGPGGGSAEKPVGLVWFGRAKDGEVYSESRIFPGGRSEVRIATVRHALDLLRAAL